MLAWVSLAKGLSRTINQYPQHTFRSIGMVTPSLSIWNYFLSSFCPQSHTPKRYHNISQTISSTPLMKVPVTIYWSEYGPKCICTVNRCTATDLSWPKE